MLKRIILWLGLLFYYIKGLPDFITWCFGGLIKRKLNSNNQSLDICFVTYNARIRETKLAYAAKLCGHRVTLITHKISLINNIEDYFDEIYFATNPWKCLKLIQFIKPDVVHLFVNYTNARMLPILWFSPAPIVYDPYDCMKGMMKPEQKLPWFEEYTEKLWFKKADHLCSRSLEPMYIKKTYNYAMPPSTFFPDYCWKKPQFKIRQEDKRDDIRIFYSGGVVEETESSCFIDLGRSLMKQQIHLHIYPSTNIVNKINRQYIFDEAKKNPYFHIHNQVPYSILMEEALKYDAAIVFLLNSESKELYVTREKFKYATSNKLFDYIESGLPVIYFEKSHMKSLTEHYGTAIMSKSYSDIRKAIISDKKKQYINNSNTSTLAFHSQRLHTMYSSVLKYANEC